MQTAKKTKNVEAVNAREEERPLANDLRRKERADVVEWPLDEGAPVTDDERTPDGKGTSTEVDAAVRDRTAQSLLKSAVIPPETNAPSGPRPISIACGTLTPDSPQRALHEPMMVRLLADCAEAMVKRAEDAERTVLGLAHQLSARGSITPDGSGIERPEEAISVVEAAHFLNLDRNTVYEMLKRGEGPPARRCGTTYRLDRNSVREWLRSGDGARTRRTR